MGGAFMNEQSRISGRVLPVLDLSNDPLQTLIQPAEETRWSSCNAISGRCYFITTLRRPGLLP